LAKFILILHNPPAPWQNLSTEELQRKVLLYQAWADKIRSWGRYVTSEKLGEEGGKLLRSFRREGDRPATRPGQVPHPGNGHRAGLAVAGGNPEQAQLRASGPVPPFQRGIGAHAEEND
jgi:hypothetical protein